MASESNDIADYEFEKYSCTKETLGETLEKYGVAIIPSVISKEEQDAMNDGLWDYLEKVSSTFPVPINRNKKKTWGSFFEMLPIHSMLMQHYQIGHAQYVWDVRQNPKVVEIFAHLWQCDIWDLLSSFDGASFNPPPEVVRQGWKGNQNWLHTDQSYSRNEFECVQSWITANEVDNGDATLTFLESSHKYHKECAEKFGLTNPIDWHLLSEEQNQFYLSKGCKLKFAKCPAGSMVFWDSRTIHAGSEPIHNRKVPKWRNVVYICQLPKHWSSDKNNQIRRQAFEDMRVTNHNVVHTKIFPLWPKRSDRKPLTGADIPRPNLSELGKSLAGL